MENLELTLNNKTYLLRFDYLSYDLLPIFKNKIALRELILTQGKYLATVSHKIDNSKNLYLFKRFDKAEKFILQPQFEDSNYEVFLCDLNLSYINEIDNEVFLETAF